MKTPHHVVKISRLSALALGTSFVCLLAPTPMVGQSHTPLVDPIPAGIPVSSITIGLEPVMTGLVLTGRRCSCTRRSTPSIHSRSDRCNLDR